MKIRSLDFSHGMTPIGGAVAPTLKVLALSTALKAGTAVSGSILYRTAGSTLSMNVPGVTVDSAAGAYSGTPATSGTFQITENLDGATNSPRVTPIVVAEADNQAPVNQTAPVITGAPQVGQTLVTSTGAWTNSPASYAYRWYRDGVVIAGATAASYVAVSDDLAKSISVEVRATNAYGTSDPAMSGSVGPVEAPAVVGPTLNQAPLLSGSVTVGEVNVATQGTWTKNAGATSAPITYERKRQRGTTSSGPWTDISGSISADYTNVSGDVGFYVRAGVRATDSTGTSAWAYSNVLGPVVAAGGIVGVGVHPDGNRLIVTVAGTPTSTYFSDVPDRGKTTYSHPDYPLTPDSAPKVKINIRRQGYAPSGAGVNAASHAYQVVATLPERRVRYTTTGDNYQLPAETVIDAEHISVPLRLSQLIHADDVIDSIVFDAGWRTGAPAAVYNVVENASTRPYPTVNTNEFNLPLIHICPERTEHRFDVDVNSHYPRSNGANRHRAVAAVRVRAYDTSSNLVAHKWIYGPSVSNQYGPLDNGYFWGCNVVSDLLGAASAPAGRYALQYTVYPWVGNPWSSGEGYPAGNVRDNWSLIDNHHAVHVFYDPAGSMWPVRYLAIDPVNGATTAAGVAAAATTESAAVAVAGSSKPKDISTAFAAANALGAGGTYALVVLIPDGAANAVHGSTSYSVVTTIDAPPPRIRGVSSATNPRQTCAVAFSGVTGGNWPTQIVMDSVSITTTAAWLQGNANRCAIFRNSRLTDLRSTATIHNSTPTDASRGYLTAAGCEFVSGWGVFTGSARFLMQRGSIFAGSMCARKIFGCTGHGDITLWGATTDLTIKNVSAPRSPGYSSASIGWTSAASYSPISGGEVTRLCIMNSLYERRGAGKDDWNPRVLQWEYYALVDSIVEGNTFVGAGFNWHSEPTAGYDHRGNRVANNIFDRMANKADDQFSTSNPPGVDYVSDDAARKAWELVYGINCEANHNLNRVQVGTSPNNQMYCGQRSSYDRPWPGGDVTGWYGVDRASVAYVSDRCCMGANPSDDVAVLGNYHLTAASTLRSKGQTANTDRDLEGTVRGATFAIGALEAVGA